MAVEEGLSAGAAYISGVGVGSVARRVGPVARRLLIFETFTNTFAEPIELSPILTEFEIGTLLSVVHQFHTSLLQLSNDPTTSV